MFFLSQPFVNSLPFLSKKVESLGPESKRVGFLIASEVLGKWVLFSCFSGTVRKLGLCH